jgi:hypothetical protein
VGQRSGKCIPAQCYLDGIASPDLLKAYNMSRLDPSVLAVASKLRGVTFHDVECGSVDGKGWGLTTTRDLTTKDANIRGLPKLITIPHDLILNQLAVEEYAKESREFGELYEAVGRQVLQTLSIPF